MKKFTIDKGTLGGGPVDELEESIARGAVAAKKVIICILTAEEKYDAMIENFVELERELLDATLDHKMFGGRTEDWFNEARNKIERRLFNLLSTCRSYLQYGSHCANEIAAQLDAYDKERQRHHTESFAYRLMEGLRHQITYAGHITHILTFSTNREDLEETDFVLNYVTPNLEISTERLVENDKLPKKLLKELAEMGEQISFLRLLREYLRRLSEIHDSLRSLCRDEVTRARQYLADIILSFRDAHPELEEIRGLQVREYDGDKLIKSFWVVEFANRLDHFEGKNRILFNLERSRVTNAVPGKE